MAWTAERLAKFRKTMSQKKFSTKNSKKEIVSKSEVKSISVAQEYHVLMAKISRRISEINSEIARLMSERSELENLIPNALDKSDWPDRPNRIQHDKNNTLHN